MKVKMLVGLCLMVLSGVLFGEEIHPDWADVIAKAGGGLVTIRPGETWVANQADMAEINKLAERKLNVEGTLILDNTTSWFSVGNVLYNCSGTIVKRGASELVQNSYQSNFNGTIIVREGTLTQGLEYLVRADVNSTAQIIVEDGATFRCNKECMGLGNCTLTIEGRGVNNGGALVVDKANSGAIPRLYLSGDALVTYNNTASPVGGFLASTAGYATVKPGTLALNGHTLTIGGTPSTYGLAVFEDCVFTGPGNVTVLAPTAGSRVLRLAGSTDFSAVGTLTLPADTTVSYMGAVPARQGAKIVAGGDLTFKQTYDSYHALPGLGTGYAHWSGDVEMPSGSTLTLAPDGTTRQVTLSGVVSGAADVQVGTSTTAAKGVAFLAGDNTYTGTTTVYGDGALSVYLGKPIAAEKLAVTSAEIYPAATFASDGTPLWTADDVLTLATNRQQATVKVATDFATNDTALVMTGTDVAKYYAGTYPTWSAFGAGLGRYTLSGPFGAENPLVLNLDSGTVRLTGTEPIALGTSAVFGTVRGKLGGTLVLDGARDVRLGTSRLVVGVPTEDKNESQPISRLVITNSTVWTDQNADNYGKGVISVGAWSWGILEIEPGSVISNKLIVGGGMSDSGAQGFAYGLGVAYQRGGTVVPFCPSAQKGSAIGYAGGGYGYYELSGGSFLPRSVFSVGYNSAGCLAIYGGEVYAPSSFYLGCSNGGDGTLFLRKGTMTVKGAFITVNGNSGAAVLTVDGPEAHLKCHENYYNNVGRVCVANGFAGATTILNANNGAIFEFGAIVVGRSDYTSPYPVIFNLNGGILCELAMETGTYVGGGIFGGGNGSQGPVSKVAVYEKGVTFDTNGRDVSTYQALTAAGAGGIQSITLSKPLTGCYAAPRVFISGDGYGATAMAQVDSRTSTVTNVIVTSHGWGYTKANTTIQLRYNKYTVKKTLTADEFVIANNETGGVTKRGAGTLTLTSNKTNTWERWTRVEGGTLKATTEKSIPDGTELQLAGGTLDLNNTTVTFSGVSGTGGTVVNGAVSVTGMRMIDIADLNAAAEDPAPVYDADIVFGAGSKLVFTGTELLNPESIRKYRLFAVGTGHVLSGTPAVEGLPEGWRVRVKPTGASLAYDYGLTVIVR